MREIKFRAWFFDPGDRLSGEMYYDVMAGNGECLFNGDWSNYPDECIIIEQFTGLHDKNGKEIYEGDIVRTWNGNKGHISYVSGHWCIGKSKKPREIETYEYEGMEVVGNIHEVTPCK